MRKVLSALFLLSLSQAAFAYDNWYPPSIMPPAGHRYPCALVPLPDSLEGIPEADRQFINHVYSMILKCLQAKLIMIDTLWQDNRSYQSTFDTYYKDTTAARQKIANEPCPKGLEDFRNDVIKAIDQQIVFFRTGTSMREAHKPIRDVMNLPEGRSASSLLQSAWGRMASRYPGWSAGVKDAIYHHLCALDLF